MPSDVDRATALGFFGGLRRSNSPSFLTLAGRSIDRNPHARKQVRPPVQHWPFEHWSLNDFRAAVGTRIRRKIADVASPERIYRGSVRAFSLVFILLGLAVLGSTLANGGGPLSVGTLLGLAFLGVGAGRLWIASRT
jgi:hypothetical protein